MKKIIMILSLIVISFTSCQKSDKHCRVFNDNAVECERLMSEHANRQGPSEMYTYDQNSNITGQSYKGYMYMDSLKTEKKEQFAKHNKCVEDTK